MHPSATTTTRPRFFSALLLALALFAATVTATAAPTLQIIDDFDDPASWTVVQDGDATLTRDLVSDESGQWATRLTVESPAGEGWAGITRGFVSADATAVEFRLRTTDFAGIAVRFNDASGETHQLRVPLADTADWQTVRIESFDGGEYWGGDGDGVFQGALGNVMIILNPWQLTSGQAPGSIEFASFAIEAEQGPEPQLSLTAGAVGNIVYAGEQLLIPVESSHPYTWQLTDLYGAVVEEGSGAAGLTAVDVPTSSLGYYSLSVTAANDVGVTTRATTIGVLDARPTGDRDFFGVATHWGQDWSEDVLDILERAGFGWARDEAYWGQVETVPGQYVLPTKVEMYTSRLEADDINHMFVLSYGNDLYEDGRAPLTPEGREAFANYALEMVNRFGTQRVYYEVWNEWNIGLGSETLDQSADAYFELLKVTVEKIRAVHPEAVLYAPGLAGADAQWLGRLYELGALELVDGISIHPYVYPDAAEGLDSILTRVRAQIDQYNPEVDIVLSEHGWPTGSANRSIDERTQAAYLLRAQAISLAHGVEQYVIYDLVDDGPNPADTEHRFGLTHHRGSELGSYTPKPSYVAQSVLMRQLDDAQFVARRVADDVHDYLFTTPDGDVRMLWSSADAVVTLAAEGDVTVTDVTGRTYRLTPDAAGNITVGLSGEPLFVEGRTGDAQRMAGASLGFASAIVGSPLRLDWSFVNPGGADATYVIDVEGRTTSQSLAAGEAGSTTLDGPVLQAEGERTVFGVVTENGVPVALLQTTGEARQSLGVTGRHALNEAGEDVLRIVVTNDAGEDLTLTGVEWALGEESGVALEGVVVPAMGRAEYQLPITASPSDYTLRATTDGGQSATDAGVLFLPDRWFDSHRYTVTPDGVLDVPSSAAKLDFAADGELWIDDHGGPEDLDVDAWVTWDDEHFYLSADVTDDVHHAPIGGSEMWGGDSLQFAVGSGTPGESSAWHEFGAALGPNGPEVYRWMAAGGAPGSVTEAVVQIVRDDAAGVTTYEVAIPWTVIDPEIVTDDLYSFSMLANDNDGQGRRGTYEWGAGISSTKDSSLFRAIRLVGDATPDPVEPEEPVKPGKPGKPEKPGSPGKPGNPGKPGKPANPGRGVPGTPCNAGSPSEPGKPCNPHG